MTTIKLRRGLSTAFSTNNPVLAAGEPAFATDTGILKIGDGTTAYNSLPSIGASPDLSNYVQKTDYASTSAAGVVKVDGSTVTIDANGVISAAGSTPSNMATTDTTQTISGSKTFTSTQTISGTTLNLTGQSYITWVGSGTSQFMISPYYYKMYFNAYGAASTSNRNILDFSTPETITFRKEASGANNGVFNVWTGSTEAKSTYRFQVSSSGVKVNNKDVVTSSDVKSIVKLTQTAYDALATKDANTFYVIIPSA